MNALLECADRYLPGGVLFCACQEVNEWRAFWEVLLLGWAPVGRGLPVALAWKLNQFSPENGGWGFVFWSACGVRMKQRRLPWHWEGGGSAPTFALSCFNPKFLK